jgi:hypothetical protein
MKGFENKSVRREVVSLTAYSGLPRALPLPTVLCVGSRNWKCRRQTGSLL